MLVDAHCHAYSFKIDELESFKEIKMIGVAEDYESSVKNIELSASFSNISPFIGAHPWNISNIMEGEVDMILNLVGSSKGIGEVGLDKRFGKRYLDMQIKVFERFCEVSSQRNLPINIHALDSWEECFKIVTKYNIKRVLFHWYTGPINLLKEIFSQGYYISINPAVMVQPKHRKILEEADLEIILTESDGPYTYRGKHLNPAMIKDLLEFIARVKEVQTEDVEKIIEKNFYRFLG
ncbi:MAG: TatD family hydrolase [Candidatus Caldarchaeales archaeon]